jgi:hypothetical protein
MALTALQIQAIHKSADYYKDMYEDDSAYDPASPVNLLHASDPVMHPDDVVCDTVLSIEEAYILQQCLQELTSYYSPSLKSSTTAAPRPPPPLLPPTIDFTGFSAVGEYTQDELNCDPESCEQADVLMSQQQDQHICLEEGLDDAAKKHIRTSIAALSFDKVCLLALDAGPRFCACMHVGSQRGKRRPEELLMAAVAVCDSMVYFLATALSRLTHSRLLLSLPLSAGDG